MLEQALNVTPITKLLSFFARGSLANCLYVSLLINGLPSNALLALFFLTTHGTVSARVLAYVFFAAQWSWIGPFLILHYETNSLPRFWIQVRKDCLLPQASVDQLSSVYTSACLGWRKWLVIAWAFCVLLVFIAIFPFMQAIGINQRVSVWYFVWCAGVFIEGLVTGIGFAGVITTVQVILSSARAGLTLRPYHPDGLGGLSSFGTLAIVSTLFFSSGTLFVPILVEIGRFQGGASPVYVLICLFSIAVAASFLVPTIVLCVRARKAKDAMIRETAEGLEKSVACAIQGTAESHELLRVIAWRDVCADIRAVRAYPFSPWIIAQLVISVVFPLLVAVLERLLL